MTENRWMELIGRAQRGGADGAAAARILLEAFINGDRSRSLGNYIAGCLGEYLRGGAPIEMALHLSGILPPVVRGPAGEGDRRRSGRAEGGGTGTHPDHRNLVQPQQGGRARRRRQPATDKDAQEKRGGVRPERRRKAAAPSRPDGN
jgi:hypothetical protein